jgi:hypothetical protein
VHASLVPFELAPAVDSLPAHVCDMIIGPLARKQTCQAIAHASSMRREKKESKVPMAMHSEAGIHTCGRSPRGRQTPWREDTDNRKLSF